MGCNGAGDKAFGPWLLNRARPLNPDVIGLKRRMIESAEQFRFLRESTIEEEYHRAAQEEAPLQVWLEILEQMPDLRFWVAHNKTVPIKILQILTNDPDANVRDVVARKRKFQESIQLTLSKDCDPSVRLALAYNAKITSRVLELLLGDPDNLVREAARQKIEHAR